MQWILIAAGLAVLLAAVLLTWLLRRKKPDTAPEADASHGFAHVKIPSQLLSLLRRAVHSGTNTQDVQALLESAHPLTEHILRLRVNLRTSPALPKGDDEPRLMDLARETVDAGHFTVDELIKALTDWGFTAASTEVSVFPLCIAAVQCQRLVLVLRSLLADAKIRRTSVRLAQRLVKHKRPYALLENANLNSLGLAELVKVLKAREQYPTLSSVEQWLAVHAISVGELGEHDAQRQVLLAEEIRRAVTCFDALSHMDWAGHCESADALHELLLNDPSDVYPRMDIPSRRNLRHQAELFSRRVRLDAADVVRQAILLCEEAEPRSLERYVGYYFQDASGMQALHHALPTKKGRLYARYSLQRENIRYGMLWGFGIITGFVFLNSGEPVFMLPFFALTVGCISRFLIRQFPKYVLPCMELTRLPEPVKTLVVLPATLHDPHEAIRMVRQLKTARHAFSVDSVDCLLLGDFTPGMTAVSSSDAAIIKAATSALAALQDDAHVFYFQRGRIWDGDRHTYAARGGSRGAVGEVCRLISQGECADVIVFSTIEPAHFERKYDYVLVLPEDRQVYPSMLERLLKTMTHPLCSRYPIGSGWRGYSVLSPESSPVFDGIGLIRPDAYLEATDGLVDPALDADSLSGELAGHTDVPDARVAAKKESDAWDALYSHAFKAWRLAGWQLPWVKTPSGLLNNPLCQQGRFRLREGLRTTLVPPGQLMLLLWATLTQNWLLLLIALLAPEISHLSLRWEDAVRAGCRLSLLPMRTVVQLRALFDALRRRPEKSPSWLSLEVWSQGIAATVFAALGIAIPGFALPSLGLSVLFACFPLAHRIMEAPVRPAEGLTNEHVALLEDAAASTWKFFCNHVSEDTRYLPHCVVQFEPPLPLSAVTSPKAVAAYLLSCVCAKDLGYVSASEAAARIQLTIETLTDLPMPYGLPCRQYALPSLTVLDAGVDAPDVGVFIAALMTTAQALRTWLPELPLRYATLSADAEKILAAIDLTALFDEQAGCFRLRLDENGQGDGYVQCFADEALLLYICACARKQIPPESLDRLSRTCVRVNRLEIPLSRHGAASEHLLAGLFLPIDEDSARRFVQAMNETGRDSLFGQGQCAHWSFDPDLRYLHTAFGLKAAAISSTETAPVYAPYAAALCLPFMPRQSADALSRFYAIGAKGPEGFCDAVDLTQGTALVGVHDAYHQGLLLAAASHLLADAPIRRYFCSLPKVEACLPLLEPKSPALVLPALPKANHLPAADAHPERTADPLVVPAEAHLLGGSDFRLVTDAHGNSAIFDGDVSLTDENSKSGLYGIQFYLADEGRVYRLGNALLQGQTVFAPGETRYEQLCGSLHAELICCADTIRHRTVHVVTITNLSTRDRLIDLADILLPDLSVPLTTVEVAHPEKGRLTLHARGTGHTLHHTMNASVPALATSICTDALAFTGRGRSLHQPASLEEPLHNLTSISTDPCLSFRARFSLGGRGQLTLWFTTSLLESDPPQLTELSGIRRLAAMQHAAIDAAAALTDTQILAAQRMITPLHQAKYNMALTLNEAYLEETLTDLLSVMGWFRLHGIQTNLHIVCPADVQNQLPDVADDHMRIVNPEEFFPDDRTLLFSGELPLLDQLDAMTDQLKLPTVQNVRPVPALLPGKELLHPSNYGGFDPETQDYVIQLEPGQTTPTPWSNRHISRYFQETTDESGFRTPFEEQVWLATDTGTLLSPWSIELPRSVRMRPGETDWEAWSDQLDIRLRAACLPGHRCGLRSLHVHNATDKPMTLRITVLAHLTDGDSPLECAPGVIMSDRPDNRLQAYIAGDGWQARRIHTRALAPLTVQPSLDAPDAASGDTALLQCFLPLEPQRSGKVLWLAGFARHGEDIARALTELQNNSTSTLLRSAQTTWSQKLNTLTFSTPEDTLDLLMNRILPVQALSAEGIAGVPAMIYLAPSEAKRTLLRQARRTLNRDDWARLSLYLAAYVLVTGDEGILHARISPIGLSLLQCCKDALLQTPLDRQGLPLGDEQALRCFLYARVADALNQIHPDTELHEFSRKLLNAADTYLWQDGYYAEPLQLDVQCLATAAYGANPRTRQAMSTCWTTLYDQLHGLIRQQMPDADAPTLPGLPDNGGMMTLAAVHCLQALLRTDHRENAFELLRALNSIHHTDDPLRMETFRCAPYQLHGGMYAAPLDAGRAISCGGDEAAALLYSVVLRDVLGFCREGNLIRLTPNVPPDWDDYTLTLHEGASTWHVSVERRVKTLTIDGDESAGHEFTVTDDGKVHQIRFPLT